MRTEIILVRHGRVVLDRDVPVANWTLSAEGTSQATALSAHPAIRRVDVTYCSPELKTRGTAQALSNGKPVRVVSGLQELDRSAAGWIPSEAEYVEMVKSILAHPSASIRGCESAFAAQERIVGAIDRLVQSHPRQTIAVDSHGIVLSLYMAYVQRLPSPDVATWQSISFPDLGIVDHARREVIAGFGEITRTKNSP